MANWRPVGLSAVISTAGEAGYAHGKAKKTLRQIDVYSVLN